MTRHHLFQKRNIIKTKKTNRINHKRIQSKTHRKYLHKKQNKRINKSSKLKSRNLKGGVNKSTISVALTLPFIQKVIFFTKTIINEYTDGLNALSNSFSTPMRQTGLGRYKLFNVDDIMRPSTARYPKYREALPSLLSNFCRGSIRRGYSNSEIEAALDPINSRYELVILALNVDWIWDVIISGEQSDFNETVKGFMIVEHGECDLYPNAYALNLICTNQDAGSGSGSILMGLYLYTIISHPPAQEDDEIDLSVRSTLTPVQPYAMLELAGAYRNQSGLCVYEKFGFREDFELYEHCYDSPGNLPMLIDFNHGPDYGSLTLIEKKRRIFGIVAGDRRKEVTRSKLCYTTNRQEQKLLGILKNIQLLDMNGEIEQINEIQTLKTIYDDVKKINVPSELAVSGSENEMGKVDSIVNYLEISPNDRSKLPKQMDLTELFTLFSK